MIIFFHTGQWTGVKFSYDLRPNLYSVIITLLTPSEDMAVKLAAANTLKQAVDDFEFNSQQFLPYLESIFGSLFQLLKEANECDTKVTNCQLVTASLYCLSTYINLFL